VVAKIIRLGHHQLREEQVDTAKVGLSLGSPAIKIKPGANLGVLDSTRVLGLTKDQARAPDLTKDQARVLGLTKGQTRVLGLTKDQTRVLGLTKDQTMVLDSTKDQARVLGLTKDQTKAPDLTKDQTRVLGSTKNPGSTKDQTQDSAVEVQTQALARAPVQTTTNKAQVDLMATQPLPHPVLMLSSAQVPSMEIMTILHPLDVAAGDVVAQLGVGVVDVVVVQRSKALEASNQEKVAMEERSDMCLRSLSKAIHVNTAEDLIVIIFFIIYPLIVL